VQRGPAGRNGRLTAPGRRRCGHPDRGDGEREVEGQRSRGGLGPPQRNGRRRSRHAAAPPRRLSGAPSVRPPGAVCAGQGRPARIRRPPQDQGSIVNGAARRQDRPRFRSKIRTERPSFRAQGGSEHPGRPDLYRTPAGRFRARRKAASDYPFRRLDTMRRAIARRQRSCAARRAWTPDGRKHERGDAAGGRFDAAGFTRFRKRALSTSGCRAARSCLCTTWRPASRTPLSRLVRTGTVGETCASPGGNRSGGVGRDGVGLSSEHEYGADDGPAVGAVPALPQIQRCRLRVPLRSEREPIGVSSDRSVAGSMIAVEAGEAGRFAGMFRHRWVRI
jgi:hypothetical protein